MMSGITAVWKKNATWWKLCVNTYLKHYFPACFQSGIKFFLLNENRILKIVSLCLLLHLQKNICYTYCHCYNWYKFAILKIKQIFIGGKVFNKSIFNFIGTDLQNVNYKSRQGK